MANSKKVTQKRKPVDFILLITLLLLLAIGIIMVLSASSPTSLSETGSSYTYVERQLVFAIVGLIIMYIISKIDYRKYAKYYKLIYIASIVMIALVPILGYSVGGAKRWINVGGFFSIQPSEIAKIGLIIFFAGYLSKKREEITDFTKGFVIPLLWLVPVIVILFVFQNHLSATLVIGAISCVMMLVAGSRFRYFLTAGLSIGTIGGIVVYILAKYYDIGAFRLARLTSFLNPWADPQGAGWQAIQGLYAIGSGGLFGLGLGNSKQKYLYISEPHNDFIFAVLAEELGFIGCALVIFLFGVLIWRGILAAMKSQDLFGTLLAIGIVSLIGIEVIINIGVVTSVLPVTGMALPFFSYGGSSLLILLAAMGILLNISRQNTKV